MTKEHGILFSPEMIQALLEHRKTMTRRTRGLEKLNENPDDWVQPYHLTVAPHIWTFRSHKTGEKITIWSPYAVGDPWYAKEPYAFEKQYDKLPSSELKGEALWWKSPIATTYGRELETGRWRSAMGMPKWVARIWGTITTIGCERVQDITEEDAMAEGITRPPCYSLTPHYRVWFKYLWDRHYGKKHPWANNDWVWKLTILP